MLHQKLEKSNPLASELADYISTETNRLSALVTRFLDFARPLHADLLASRKLRNSGTRSARCISLTENGDPASAGRERHYQAHLPLVPLDESFREQAFVNLIQNAYDAMGSDGGILRVTAGRAQITPTARESKCGSKTPGREFR